MLCEFNLGDLVIFKPTTYVDYDDGTRKVGLIVNLTRAMDHGNVPDAGNVLYHILHEKGIIQRFSSGIEPMGNEV
jgi:hypothetical protein